MKTVILTLLVMATSIPAFAKLTVFNTTDAIKFVLEDQKTMQQILGKTLRESEVNSITVSWSSKGFSKYFTVRIGTSSNTPVGERPCSTDVSVETQTKMVGLPGGSTGISTSRLAISKVGPTVCAP